MTNRVNDMMLWVTADLLSRAEAGESVYPRGGTSATELFERAPE